MKPRTPTDFVTPTSMSLEILEETAATTLSPTRFLDVLLGTFLGCSGGAARGSNEPANIYEGSGAALNVPNTHIFPNHFSTTECAKSHRQQSRISKLFLGAPLETPLSGRGTERRNKGRGQGKWEGGVGRRGRKQKGGGKGKGRMVKRRSPKKNLPLHDCYVCY